MPNYLLRVIGSCEHRAARDLKRLGLTTVCPLRPHARRSPHNRRKVQTVMKPVLPGYMVICGAVSWPEVLSSKWVLGAVGWGGQPAELSDAIVEHIERLAGEIEPEQRVLFRPGQTVEIIDGPLSGNTCKIEKAWSAKARVILDGFGVATVDISKLEAA